MSPDPPKPFTVSGEPWPINIKQEKPDDDGDLIECDDDKKVELEEITTIHRQIEVLRTMLDQERRTKAKQVELMETMLARERAIHCQEMTMFEKKIVEQDRIYKEDIALQKKILEEERAIHQQKTALYEESLRKSSSVWTKLEKQVATIGKNLETLLRQQAQSNATQSIHVRNGNQETPPPLMQINLTNRPNLSRSNEFADNSCLMKGQEQNRAWVAGRQQSIARNDRGAFVKTSYVAHQVDFVPNRAEPLLSRRTATEILETELLGPNELPSRFIARMRLVAYRGGVPDHKALHWAINKLPYRVRSSIFVWITQATWENVIQTLEWMESNQNGQSIQNLEYMAPRGPKRQGQSIGWNTSTPKRFRRW
ncbi:hypothetical protein QAD02_004394 [Eretmocerus hayati]|uniref:Uncharacterized protein n=1 Tax=Eretmocerus hayati TaxID=131215 RepID=A0ACC2NPU5_9HYME|nr:hypothetical protein QAD02_004394 [Eretmocerus hayati]